MTVKDFIEFTFNINTELSIEYYVNNKLTTWYDLKERSKELIKEIIISYKTKELIKEDILEYNNLNLDNELNIPCGCYKNILKFNIILYKEEKYV